MDSNNTEEIRAPKFSDFYTFDDSERSFGDLINEQVETLNKDIYFPEKNTGFPDSDIESNLVRIFWDWVDNHDTLNHNRPVESCTRYEAKETSEDGYYHAKENLPEYQAIVNKMKAELLKLKQKYDKASDRYESTASDILNRSGVYDAPSGSLSDEYWNDRLLKAYKEGQSAVSGAYSEAEEAIVQKYEAKLEEIVFPVYNDDDVRRHLSDRTMIPVKFEKYDGTERYVIYSKSYLNFDSFISKCITPLLNNLERLSIARSHAKAEEAPRKTKEERLKENAGYKSGKPIKMHLKTPLNLCIIGAVAVLIVFMLLLPLAQENVFTIGTYPVRYIQIISVAAFLLLSAIMFCLYERGVKNSKTIKYYDYGKGTEDAVFLGAITAMLVFIQISSRAMRTLDIFLTLAVIFAELVILWNVIEALSSLKPVAAVLLGALVTVAIGVMIPLGRVFAAIILGSAAVVYICERVYFGASWQKKYRDIKDAMIEEQTEKTVRTDEEAGKLNTMKMRVIQAEVDRSLADESEVMRSYKVLALLGYWFGRENSYGHIRCDSLEKMLTDERRSFAEKNG